MKKFIKILIFIILLFIVFVGFVFFYFENPLVYKNNTNLKNSILSLELNKDYTLGEIVPFEFDTLYVFEPYTSKSDIETILGFKSFSIKDNISDDMYQFLFVKDDKIVSSICDYSVNLGYKFVNFDNRVYEDSVFSVYEENNIVVLDSNLVNYEEKNKENLNNEDLDLEKDENKDDIIDSDKVDKDIDIDIDSSVKDDSFENNNKVPVFKRMGGQKTDDNKDEDEDETVTEDILEEDLVEDNNLIEQDINSNDNTQNEIEIINITNSSLENSENSEYQSENNSDIIIITN